MIGSPGLVSLHMYLYIFIFAVAILAVLGIFIHNLYSRLSIRIIALIFVSGPIALVITRGLNDLFLGVDLPVRFRLIEIVLTVLGGPVVLGLLATGFIRRPLRQFGKTMTSLERSDYKVKIQPTGIYEFDEVFSKFNELMHQLQHEEKLRKDLISDTSHELNTPLTTMIGQLTAMEEGKYSLSKERVSILKEQTERLANLVQQLDTYTKARIPATDKAEDIHFAQFCEELKAHHSLELEKKGISVDLHIPKEYNIHASRRALQQIFTNLIQNALRYSGASKISITATADHIVFSDNGIGVPPESLPYLFERFYRVDASRNRSEGGLGLGLAIVHELAAGQGWSVQAKSANPGLAFHITLSNRT